MGPSQLEARITIGHAERALHSGTCSGAIPVAFVQGRHRPALSGASAGSSEGMGNGDPMRKGRDAQGIPALDTRPTVEAAGRLYWRRRKSWALADGATVASLPVTPCTGVHGPVMAGADSSV